jgi:anti-anti-sigma factor
MKAKLQRRPAAVVCHLEGDLDYRAKDTLETCLATLDGGQRVVFDMSGVPFVDSAGLAALLGIVRRVRVMGGNAVICCRQPSVRGILKAVLVPSSASLFDDTEDAMSYLVPARAA